MGRIVGTVRGQGPRIALGDSIGLALARRTGGEFVTSDHHEIDAVLPLGLCVVRFIR